MAFYFIVFKVSVVRDTSPKPSANYKQMPW